MARSPGGPAEVPAAEKVGFGPGAGQLDEGRPSARLHDGVVVEEPQELRTTFSGDLHPDVAGAREPKVAVELHEAHTVDGLEPVPGIVRGAVLDHDDLDRSVVESSQGGDAIQRVPPSAIIHEDDAELVHGATLR